MALAEDAPSAGDPSWYLKYLPHVNVQAIINFLMSKPGGIIVALLLVTWLVRWGWKDAKIRTITIAALAGFVAVWLARNGAFG